MGLIYPYEFQFLSHGRFLTTYTVSIMLKINVTPVVAHETYYYIFNRFYFANALTEHKSAFVFFVYCLISKACRRGYLQHHKLIKNRQYIDLCLYNLINIDWTDTLTLNVCNFILRLFFYCLNRLNIEITIDIWENVSLYSVENL